MQTGNTHKTGMVRLKDIAEKTGFTINTVSRALKDKNDISEKTKFIINQTADEMGYIRDSIASYMRTGTTKTIAVILGDISNLRLSIWVKEIEQWADRRNYITFILNTDENQETEKKAIISALSKMVDGILLCPAQESEDNVRFLQSKRIPFVLLGRRFPGMDCSYVISNDTKGGYLATKHLIRNGHKRILMLNADPYISSAQERWKGYRHALLEADIPHDDALVHRVSPTAGGCARELKKLVQNGLEFTGIFAFSDLIAFEAIYTLNEMGIRVPDHMGIVGFDNIQEYALLSTPLDTITHVGESVPARAVRMLLDMIEKGNTGAVEQVVLDVELKERGSAGKGPQE